VARCGMHNRWLLFLESAALMLIQSTIRSCLLEKHAGPVRFSTSSPFHLVTWSPRTQQKLPSAISCLFSTICHLPYNILPPFSFLEAVEQMHRRDTVGSPAHIFLTILPALKKEIETKEASERSSYTALMKAVNHGHPHQPEYLSSKTMGRRRNNVRKLADFYQGRPYLDPYSTLKPDDDQSVRDEDSEAAAAPLGSHANPLVIDSPSTTAETTTMSSKYPSVCI